MKKTTTKVGVKKRPSPADIGDLKAAADRLAEALRGVDEEELLQEFRELRRAPKTAA